MTTPSRKPSSGFTLVELLIVVLILAILAAAAIPTFNNASAESKESALASNLATVRQAIAIYRVQHLETYPGPTWTEFVDQLTQGTNEDGSLGGPLGPYLRTGWPENPVSEDPSGTIATTFPTGPSDSNGYVYMPSTGQLWADTSGAGPSGTLYWDL